MFAGAGYAAALLLPGRRFPDRSFLGDMVTVGAITVGVVLALIRVPFFCRTA